MFSESQYLRIFSYTFYKTVLKETDCMQDSTLLKMALLTSIIGLILLAIILSTMNFEEVDISQTRDLEEGMSIKVSGVVERVNSKDGFSVLSIRKEEMISVVVFDSVNITKGQRIEVRGRIKDYKGEKELIADSIILK